MRAMSASSCAVSRPRSARFTKSQGSEAADEYGLISLA